MNLNKIKLLLVIWQDAQADVRWDDRDAEILERDTSVYSIGWLIAKNDDFILLAADIDYRGMSSRTLQIPVGCITSSKSIKVGKK